MHSVGNNGWKSNQHGRRCSNHETTHFLWARMGGNQINMAVGAQFTRRRTSCGREWVEIRSTWPSVLNSRDDARTVGENGWKSDQHGRRCSIHETTHSLWARMGGNQINMAVGAQFTRRRTTCGREWVEIRSTWPSVLNSRDDALSVGENGWKSDQHGRRCSIHETTHELWARMGGNQINMAVGAQFTRRRTSCGREWVEIRSTWPSVLNSRDDARTVGENGWKSDQHGRRCSIHETTHSLWARMGGNQINMAVGAQFTRRRTTCGREWVEIRSTWPSVLNSRDDALSVGENGWKSDQHGRRCSIHETTHFLWARMGGNQINMAVGAQFTRRRTSCGREWVEIRSTCPSVLNSRDDARTVGENGWKSDQHGRRCSIHETTHGLWARMGGNQINMAVGAQFTRRRTNCGREWVEIRSTWPSVLNSRDDARTVGENGWKSDQHGRRCSIHETTHGLWARMGGNQINMAVGAQFTRRRTSCGREWVEI